MKNAPEHDREDMLLDAVLREDAWADIHAASKSAALAEFHAVRRRRRFAFWTAQAAAFVLATAGAAWWMRQPPVAQTTPVAHKAPTIAAQPPQVAKAAPASPQPADKPVSPAYISEAEMVALFPKGSCEVVEIDGRKQLVFYDAKIEREGASYHPGG